jgi:hypothetical protein
MVLLWWRRVFFAAPLPMLGTPLADRWTEPVTLAGAAMAACGLAFFAAKGFAPDGHFPWVTALVFLVGVVLAAFRPAELSRSIPR